MKTIGKYQVVGEIGSSAAGKTYRARDAFRNRDLAVKLLASSSALNAVAKEQFYREFATCAEMTHRHIVVIHDLGEVDEGIYVAAEFLAGVDLRRHLVERDPLAIGQKLAMVAQVCEGLAYAHGKGIAHGNIKPSNIFIGAGSDATILDFGIGKWQESILAAGAKPEGLMPNYLAPEQIMGQSFDARSDLFSVGLVLYELLAGKYPFEVAEGLIPREIVHTELSSLRAVDAQIPEELDQLLVRALKKNPQDRLQTADEFAASLYTIAQQLRRSQAAPAPEAPAAVAPTDPEPVAPVEAAPMPFTAMPVTAARPVTPLRAALMEKEAEAAVSSQPRVEVKSPYLETPLPPPVASIAVTEAVQAVPETNPIRPRPSQPSVPPEIVAMPAPRPAQVPPRPHSPVPPAPVVRPAIRPVTPAQGPQKTQPQVKVEVVGKRVLTTMVGAVLALCLVAAFVTWQSSHATPSKPPVQSTPSKITAPEPKAVAPVQSYSEPAKEPAKAAPVRADPAPEEMLRIVRALWEAGKYAPAMKLVDEILIMQPANSEARTWKKKIRAAEDAEAAIK